MQRETREKIIDPQIEYVVEIENLPSRDELVNLYVEW